LAISIVPMFFLDSERTEEAIDFTMMSYFFLYLATIQGSKIPQ